MTRPTLEREIALRYLERYEVALDDTQPLVVLGVRGGLEPVPGVNKIGGFDDLIVVVTADLCEAFTGNTDPSTEVLNRANLVEGVSWFRPGYHHPNSPKQYPAFVQDGLIVVARWDTDDVAEGTKDWRGECLGGGLWRGDFAIHVHNAMGEWQTGSEGCQTIIKHEWNDFYGLVKGRVDAFQLSRFPYLLAERTSADA